MPIVDTDRSPGRFWLAETPDRHVGGWLDLSSRRPRLDVAESLTPWLRVADQKQQPGGTVVTWVPADDDVQPSVVTIHGLIRKGPRRHVTLFDAHNVGRQQLLGVTLGDTGSEQLEADVGFLGSSYVDADARFMQARVRFRHLDVWAHMPGLEVEVSEDGAETVIRSARPEPLVTDLARPAGKLVVELNLPMVDLSVRGANLRRNATLRFESAGNGLTFQDLLAEVVNPLGLLLSLALDVDCPPVRLEVQTADGHWLQVVHPSLEVEAAGSSTTVLLWREQLNLDILGNWLSRFDSLSPVPQLVAGVALGSPDRTLENQLLELATAAEGLHRRLIPKQRVMTRAQARAAARDASDAVVEGVRATVKERLGHLEDPSYRERLRALVVYAGDLAEMLGDAERWIARVTPARNGFAHRLAGGAGAEFDEHFVLMRSLRWFLTALLLLEAGVSPPVLQERLSSHQPYLHFLRQARRWLPAVYRSDDG